MVILTDDDFADLPLTTSHAIDVLEFVPAEQVDPILYNKAYYMEPDGTATKPYVLLRDALTDSDRVAIVKVALRQREQLATLRVRDSVLVLNTMLWPDEIRQPEFGFLDEDVAVRAPELAMASSLIESMAGDFDPDDYTDNYRAALQEVIDAKVEGREVVAPEDAEEAPAAAVDLMAALRASVDRARTARGESASGGGGGRAGAGGGLPVAVVAAGSRPRSRRRDRRRRPKPRKRRPRKRPRPPRRARRRRRRRPPSRREEGRQGPGEEGRRGRPQAGRHRQDRPEEARREEGGEENHAQVRLNHSRRAPVETHLQPDRGPILQGCFQRAHSRAT